MPSGKGSEVDVVPVEVGAEKVLLVPDEEFFQEPNVELNVESPDVDLVPLIVTVHELVEPFQEPHRDDGFWGKGLDVLPTDMADGKSLLVDGSTRRRLDIGVEGIHLDPVDLHHSGDLQDAGDGFVHPCGFRVDPKDFSHGDVLSVIPFLCRAGRRRGVGT